MRSKVTVNEGLSFIFHVSGIWLLHCSKLDINRKHNKDVTTYQNDVVVNFIDNVFLIKFIYWPKFHINIITGFTVMIISIYKGLIRNAEIGNSPV